MKMSKFKYNFACGEQDSLDFHNALTKCEKTEIFRTECIRALIKSKLNYLTMFYYYHMFLYIGYIAAIMTHANMPDNKLVAEIFIGYSIAIMFAKGAIIASDTAGFWY